MATDRLTSFLLLCAQRLLSLVHLCVLLFANGYLLAGKKYLYNNLKAYACKSNRYEEKMPLYPFVYQSVTKPVLKDVLLQCKRASFTWQKSTFYFSVMNLSYKSRMLSGVHFNPISYPTYIIMVYRALFVHL